jgi:hypothetical protein
MGIFTLNKYLNLSIAFIIVLSNVIIDHFFAPTGILLCPITIILSVIFINFNKEKFDFLFLVIITFIFIAFNDIGLKLYGGGIHDGEGQGVLNLFLMCVLIPALIILIISAIINKGDSILKKTGSICLFLFLACFYLYFFKDLGLGREYL